MNIGQTVREAAADLSAAGVDNPSLDADVLVCFFSGMERYRIKAYPEKELEPAVYKKIRSAVKRRCSGEPVAYITGHKEFYGLDFTVNRHVLVPRPETELLVDLAVYYIPMNGSALDLCTGSGCIAVAVKHSRADADMTASDISSEALTVARKNSREILGPGKIAFKRGDLFESFEGMKFDCIVTNPPYVDPALKSCLPVDLSFEPETALFAENGGRAVAARIIAESSAYLKENGIMLMEIGEDAGDYVKEQGRLAGFAVSVMNDYSGLPRVAVLKKQP